MEETKSQVRVYKYDTNELKKLLKLEGVIDRVQEVEEEQGKIKVLVVTVEEFEE